MARVDIPVEAMSRTLTLIGSGGSEVTGDAANEHDFDNDGNTVLVVRNAGSTSRTVEIVVQQTVDGQTPPVKSLTLANAAHFVVGPFSPTAYNIAGKVQVNVDHTEVRLQALSVNS